MVSSLQCVTVTSRRCVRESGSPDSFYPSFSPNLTVNGHPIHDRGSRSLSRSLFYLLPILHLGQCSRDGRLPSRPNGLWTFESLGRNSVRLDDNLVRSPGLHALHEPRVSERGRRTEDPCFRCLGLGVLAFGGTSTFLFLFLWVCVSLLPPPSFLPPFLVPRGCTVTNSLVCGHSFLPSFSFPPSHSTLSPSKTGILIASLSPSSLSLSLSLRATPRLPNSDPNGPATIRRHNLGRQNHPHPR